MRAFLILLTCFAVAVVPLPARAADNLKVIVVDGDEAANIVAERLAAEPVIEVRDKDDRRVPGAVVRFVIRKTRDRIVASFGNGQAEVRTLTDYTGRASVNAVSPVEPGSFQIDVEVSYRGQTGRAVIRQTNFPTSADAKAAGREPGKSTNSTQTATTGATTGAAATTATTAATTSTTATSAAVAAGGGMSKLAVVGILAGGAAGAGAAVVLTQKKSEPPATVAPIVASQAVGIYTGTVFTFSAQGTGFEASTLYYHWEFGDGTASADPSPTHVYGAPGTYTVAVTVGDARRSARSEMGVTILALTGTWVSTTGRTTLYLTQSGSTIAGSGDFTGINTTTGVLTPYPGCALSGSVERGAAVPVNVTRPLCRHPQNPTALLPSLLSLTVSPDGRSLVGVASSDGQADQSVTLTRQ